MGVSGSDTADERAHRKRYSGLKPFYTRLAAEVKHTLQEQLRSEGVELAIVTSRVKRIESFIEKISRKRYDDPFQQTTDLAGIRFVCPYEADLERVGKVIHAAFTVHESVDKARNLGVDRMGYQGRAFVIRLGPAYAGGRYDGITDLLCEIQVRTILQDAWAVIDHQLVYKREKATPTRVRRDLNNVASLLEIAQGIFDSIREKRWEYIEEIKEKREQIDTQLDGDPTRFLSQPVDFDTIMAYARWKYPKLQPSEDVTQALLRDLDLDRYPTLKSLDAVIERAEPAVAIYRQENPAWFKFSTDYLTKSLGFLDAAFRENHGFAPRTLAAFVRLAHEVRPPEYVAHGA